MKALTGCDLLTISPKLLSQLDDDSEVLKPKLDAKAAKALDIKKIPMDEKKFRFVSQILDASSECPSSRSSVMVLPGVTKYRSINVGKMILQVIHESSCSYFSHPASSSERYLDIISRLISCICLIDYRSD